MIEYEISYEDCEDSRKSEIYGDEVEMAVTEYSVNSIVFTLKILEEFTKMWRGRMKVSYYEAEDIRDYTIKIIADEVEFYNGYMKCMFSELLKDVKYITVRPCFENRDKMELVVIQSNAEEIEII